MQVATPPRATVEQARCQDLRAARARARLARRASPWAGCRAHGVRPPRQWQCRRCALRVWPCARTEDVCCKAYTVSAQDWFSQFILSYAEARRDPERHFERETVKTLPDTLSRLNSDCDSPRGGARGPWSGRVSRHTSRRAARLPYMVRVLHFVHHPPEGTCSAPGLPTADRGDRSAGWSVEQTGEPTRGTKRSVN